MASPGGKEQTLLAALADVLVKDAGKGTVQAYTHVCVDCKLNQLHCCEGPHEGCSGLAQPAPWLAEASQAVVALLGTRLVWQRNDTFKLMQRTFRCSCGGSAQRPVLSREAPGVLWCSLCRQPVVGTAVADSTLRYPRSKKRVGLEIVTRAAPLLELAVQRSNHSQAHDNAVLHVQNWMGGAREAPVTERYALGGRRVPRPDHLAADSLGDVKTGAEVGGSGNWSKGLHTYTSTAPYLHKVCVVYLTNGTDDNYSTAQQVLGKMSHPCVLVPMARIHWWDTPAELDQHLDCAPRLAMTSRSYGAQLSACLPHLKAMPGVLRHQVWLNGPAQSGLQATAHPASKWLDRDGYWAHTRSTRAKRTASQSTSSRSGLGEGSKRMRIATE